MYPKLVKYEKKLIFDAGGEFGGVIRAQGISVRQDTGKMAIPIEILRLDSTPNQHEY